MTASPEPVELSAEQLFASARERQIDEAIIVGSSPRAPALLREEIRRLASEDASALYLGLNAALRLVRTELEPEEPRPPSWTWSIACDWRTAGGLAEEMGPALTADVIRLWSTNVKGSSFIDCDAPLVPLRYLGDIGFSDRAEVGIYSGYTVAYVASQVLLRTDITTVRFVGVDLSYGMGKRPRFYGGPAAATDRQSLGRQISNMRLAVANLRAAGIEVTTPEPFPRWFVKP